MKKRILIIAPIDSSAFSSSVMIECLKLDEVDVCGVLVRSISYQRFRNEFKRDGIRLLRKFIKKFLFKDKTINYNSPIPTARDRLIADGYKNWSLKNIANDLNIPILNSSNFNTAKVYEFIKKCNPTVCIFTGGGILSEKLLKLSGEGVLNCHIGSLPEFRGMDVVEWPFLVNSKNPNLEMTIHFMEKGIDTGPIVLKKPLPVQHCNNIQELRIALEGVKIDALLEVVQMHINDQLKPTVQNVNEGKQYYVMHPALLSIAKLRARKYLKKLKSELS